MSYVIDRGGIAHYNPSRDVWHIREALVEALAERDVTHPCWFWWNGTFCPIYPEDTVAELYARWAFWREDYQDDHASLLLNLGIMSGVRQ